MNKVTAFFSFLTVLVLGAIVFAQPTIFDPPSWFTSVEAVIAAAGLITPLITKVLTSLGKDWFNTEGPATRYLALGVAILIGGVGGYLSLGFLAGVSGLAGALNAMIIVAMAFFGASGMAAGERQVATSAVKKLQTEFREEAVATLAAAEVAAEKRAQE